MDARAKAWSRLLSGDGTWAGITRLRILQSNIFQAQEIQLGRTTALLGSHGGGKTMLLRMIEMAFGQESHENLFPYHSRAFPDEHIPRLTGRVGVTFQLPSGDLIEREVDLTLDQDERVRLWADALPPNLEPWHISALHAFAMLQMLMQQYPGKEGDGGVAGDVLHTYSAKELNALHNILGRRYDSAHVRLYEADRNYFVPFVEASVRNKDFRTGSMSFGEIWVHFIVGYALRFDWDGPLLLDEPESLLAPRGQRPFIDEIARVCLAKQSQLVVATHSPNVLERFPVENILMCVDTGSGVRIIAPSSLNQIRDSIGLQTPLRGLVLVEDAFAGEVLTCLMAALAPGTGRQLEIVSAGGAADALRTASTLRNLARMTCRAVLDGDQRHRVSGSHVLFLPGNSAPEEELIEAAVANSNVVSQQLGITVDDVVLAVSSIQDLDHQYIPTQLSQALGKPEPVVLAALVGAWLQDAGARQQAEALVEALNP